MAIKDFAQDLPIDYFFREVTESISQEGRVRSIANGFVKYKYSTDPEDLQNDQRYLLNQSSMVQYVDNESVYRFMEEGVGRRSYFPQWAIKENVNGVMVDYAESALYWILHPFYGPGSFAQKYGNATSAPGHEYSAEIIGDGSILRFQIKDSQTGFVTEELKVDSEEPWKYSEYAVYGGVELGLYYIARCSYDSHGKISEINVYYMPLNTVNGFSTLNSDEELLAACKIHLHIEIKEYTEDMFIGHEDSFVATNLFQDTHYIYDEDSGLMFLMGDPESVFNVSDMQGSMSQLSSGTKLTEIEN